MIQAWDSIFAFVILRQTTWFVVDKKVCEFCCDRRTSSLGTLSFPLAQWKELEKVNLFWISREENVLKHGMRTRSRSLGSIIIIIIWSQSFGVDCYFLDMSSTCHLHFCGMEFVRPDLPLAAPNLSCLYSLFVWSVSFRQITWFFGLLGGNLIEVRTLIR
jgi:hypothetical protein